MYSEIPAFTRSYEETKAPARVLNVSSIGHQLAPGRGIEFESLKGGAERDAWIKMNAPWWQKRLQSVVGYPAP